LGTALTAGPHLSASGAKRKGEKGRCCAGGVADWANLGRCARGEKKKKRPAGLGWLQAKSEGRDREREKGFLFLLKFLFKFIFFKHSNFNQTKSMHSNHDAQTLIISKLF
jgi:hypothetical protein